MSSLDARMLGCAAIAWHPFPGLPEVQVGIRVLSEPERVAALEEARGRARAFVGSTTVSDASLENLTQREFRRLVLSRSVLVDDGDGHPQPIQAQDLRVFDAETVDRLFGLYARSSREADGADETPESLLAALDALAASPLERFRAEHAAGLVAYYGAQSARALTTWQVLVYARLIRGEA